LACRHGTILKQSAAHSKPLAYSAARPDAQDPYLPWMTGKGYHLLGYCPIAPASEALPSLRAMGEKNRSCV
jgi:hypothetical protein